jgi:hypothetical protein
MLDEDNPAYRTSTNYFRIAPEGITLENNLRMNYSATSLIK